MKQFIKIDLMCKKEHMHIYIYKDKLLSMENMG